MLLIGEQPANFISDNFNLEEIRNLCGAIGVSYDNLAGSTPKSKARELQSHMERNMRLGDLLEAVRLFKDFFDPTPYIYLMIQRHLRKPEMLTQLCQDIQLNCVKLKLTLNDLFAYEHNDNFRREKALVLQKNAADNGRTANLVQAMHQRHPDLNLNAYKDMLDAQPAQVESVPPLQETQPKPITTIQYENFDLRIGTAVNNEYPVEVLNSPMGQVMPVMQSFPLDDYDFTDLVSYLKGLVGKANDAVELGQKMRELLFPGPVWSKFIENRSVLKAQEKGLRLRLRIDPPELSQLPWEYCHDKTFDFLGQDKTTPFIRYPAESLASADLESTYPIKILLVTANPSDLPQLKLEKEVAIVEEALAPLIELGYAELETIEKAQVREMRRKLRDGRSHVLHFLGHGLIEGGEGAIALEKEDGTKQAVFASQLRAMLRSTSIKIIYLNACETATHDGVHPINSVARSLIRAGIPAVMAMQFEVPDKTALLFSRELYQSLAQGKPLDLAITEMRQAAYIDEGDRVYWGIPVLFMRSQDGVLWQPNKEIMAQLATYKPKSKTSQITERVQAIRTLINTVQGELDKIDADDIANDLDDVEKMLKDETVSAARVQRKLNNVINILEIYGPTVADPIKPKIQETIQIVEQLEA